jgi:hypothetical protein
MLKDARRTSSTRGIFQWQKRTYMMPDILHAQVEKFEIWIAEAKSAE